MTGRPGKKRAQCPARECRRWLTPRRPPRSGGRRAAGVCEAVRPALVARRPCPEETACDPARLWGAFSRDVTGADLRGDVRPGGFPAASQVNPGSVPIAFRPILVSVGLCCGFAGCHSMLCPREPPAWAPSSHWPRLSGRRSAPRFSSQAGRDRSLWAVGRALFFVSFCAFCWCFYG